MNKRLSQKKFGFFCLLVALLLNGQQLLAQRNFTLYSLNETSQAFYLNPGFKQKNRLYISLPLGYQSITALNTGFTLNNLLKKEANDSLYIVPSGATAKMAKINFLNVESYNEIFGVGFKVKKNYFSFNVANRLQTRFTYPKGLMDLVTDGNGKDLLGKRASMNGLGFDLMSYVEYGLGYNRDINDKLTVGGRVKLISGIANIQTKKSQLGLTTDASTFDLTVDGSMLVNSSNISQFYKDSNYNASTMAKSAYNFQNFGLGMDLGASYKMNDKISFSASMLDLGFIKWKTNVTNYASNTIDYTFKGVDLNKVLFDSLNPMKGIGDTLNKTFNGKETSKSYSTALHTKFYLGGKYKLNKYFSGGLLMYNEIVAKKYTAGVSASMVFQARNWLGVSLNYSMYGRSYNNLGFGINIKGGPIQFYVMSDNLMAFVNPASAKMVHVSTGMNIVIGPRKDKDKDGVVDKHDKCPDIAGLEYFKGCPDRDNDSIIDSEDECPDVAGLRMFKGCPDKDKDSVQDKFDDCPDIAGLVKFKGCPDRDKDSIIDSKDDCPDIAGLVKFKGCPDTDKDGIKDSEDQCPDVAGTLVNQGCPDTDLDGIIDQLDNCPKEAGPKENVGCPWPDTDKDGLLDKDDKCPNLAGPIANHGCPYEDTDGDGILDHEDQCPSVKGVLENHGCPKIEEAAKEILKTAFDNLEFGTGNAVIKEASHKSLDDLAGLLLKKKDWKLQIAGHTDNVGNDQVNLILSKKRAEAVRDYLVSKGVPADRIRTLFFGETQPIASNDTEEGRQKNRRVEMTIVFE